jgi:hypothetical protein
MQNQHAILEELFEKVRAMPAPQQDLIADALADLTADVYQLSDAELALLEPELEGARSGEFADRAAVNAVLHTPWTNARQS